MVGDQVGQARRLNRIEDCNKSVQRHHFAQSHDLFELVNNLARQCFQFRIANDGFFNGADVYFEKRIGLDEFLDFHAAHSFHHYANCFVRRF